MFSNLVSYVLWFLQNFRLEEVPLKEYGQFYSGDTYVVLNVSWQFSPAKFMRPALIQTKILVQTWRVERALLAW